MSTYLQTTDMATKRTRKLQIRVRRDSFDGYIFSEFIDLNIARGEQDKSGEPKTRSIVIDREQRRGVTNAESVVRRAESLSKLTGIPLEVDLEWHCVADLSLNCRCPKCINKESEALLKK